MCQNFEKKIRLNPLKIKVCGITTLQDACELDAMGIDYLGFNFYPGSKRYIHPEKAKSIIQKLNQAKPVGIFVDQPVEEVKNAIQTTGIRFVQLHGSESADYVRSLPVPVIKAVGISSQTGEIDAPPEGVHFLLYDTKTEAGFGGTGKSFNWHLLASINISIPFFLAGGLGPENLSEALGNCHPYAVDLNSRVEIAPGKKDMGKVRACMEIMRGRLSRKRPRKPD